MADMLHIFPFSNFCEKARWCLDHAGIPYEERLHLPGPHAGTIKKLSGQTAVPIFEHGGTVVTGSDRIAEICAVSGAGSPLIHPDDRDEIIGWQTRLDAIGGTLRGTLFHDILSKPGAAADILTGGSSTLKYRLMFRGLCPMLRSMLKKELPDMEKARQDCTAVMDAIVVAQKETGYLVGGRFSLADLTASAIMYPLVLPDQALSAPHARSHPAMKPWLAHWADHPVRNYIARIYRHHRRPFAA